MARRKKPDDPAPVVMSRPPLTPEARENQLISLALDLIERRLRDGSASSQETTSLLKYASSKHRLELEILEKQKELISAKTESLHSGRELNNLYARAMKAFGTYSGREESDDED